MAGLGIVEVATALFLFFLPGPAASVWPWTITPLTSRVLAGWIALPGALALAIASERRWSAVRIPLQTGAIGAVLTAVGMMRSWSDWKQDSPLTWLVAVGFVVAAVGLVAIDFAMEARRRSVSAMHESLSG
jgi:hypothetical protein